MYWADASWFIALLDPRDQWHAQARELLPEAEAAVPLETHVLAAGEIIAVVGSRSGGKAAREVWESLLDNTRIRTPGQEDLVDAMEVVVRSDGRLSLSDALFVQWMSAGDSILSFDRDFDGYVERMPR